MQTVSISVTKWNACSSIPQWECSQAQANTQPTIPVRFLPTGVQLSAVDSLCVLFRSSTPSLRIVNLPRSVNSLPKMLFNLAKSHLVCSIPTVQLPKVRAIGCAVMTMASSIAPATRKRQTSRSMFSRKTATTATHHQVTPQVLAIGVHATKPI